MDREDARQGMERLSQTAQSSQNSSSARNPPGFAFKAYYFLFYAAIGSSLPYLTLYFKQLGLTAGDAGILNGVRLLTDIIGSPLWGMVGDKYRIRKVMLLASLVSFAAGTLLLMAVRPQNQQCLKIEANKTEITSLIFTSEGYGRQQQGYINNTEMNSEIKELLRDKNQRFQNHSGPPVFTREVDETEIRKIFIIFLVIIFTSQIIGSVVFTMPDALLMDFLKENIHAFGSFRMWGELGIAGASFIVGEVINFYQSEVCGETVKNYFISFYFFAGFIALAIFTVSFMDAGGVSYTDPETSTEVTLLPLVKELLKFNNVIFIIAVCYLGMLTGFHEYFGFWYLDDLGAQPYVLGIVSGLRYTLAMLGYFMSEFVISKFGHLYTITITLALYVAVYMGLAFVLNPWLGGVLYSAQGLLYGTSWAACVVFGATISLRLGYYTATQGKRILKISILPTNCRRFLLMLVLRN